MTDRPPSLYRPGDVFTHSWSMGKSRPWMILWVDDEEETCCVVAFSRQDFPSSIPVNERWAHAAPWVMVQPVGRIDPDKIVGYIEKPLRDKIAAQLHDSFGLAE